MGSIFLLRGTWWKYHQRRAQHSHTATGASETVVTSARVLDGEEKRREAEEGCLRGVGVCQGSLLPAGTARLHRMAK